MSERIRSAVDHTVLRRIVFVACTIAVFDSVCLARQCASEQVVFPDLASMDDFQNWGGAGCGIAGPDMLMARGPSGSGIAVFRASADGGLREVQRISTSDVVGIATANDATCFAPITDNGRVSIYERSGASGYSLRATLFGDAAGEGFGTSIAFNQNATLMAVGAPTAGADPFADAGKVYVYSRSSAGDWVFLTSVTPATGPVAFANFGGSVAISTVGSLGDFLAVSDGQTSRAYLFRRSGNTFVQESAVTHSSAVDGSGGGFQVRLCGATMFHWNNGLYCGSRFDVLTRTGGVNGSWARTQTLSGCDVSALSTTVDSLAWCERGFSDNFGYIRLFRKSGVSWTNVRTQRVDFASSWPPLMPVAIGGDTLATADVSASVGSVAELGSLHLYTFRFSDCDGDGVSNQCEIAKGNDNDINWNGVPDGCEAIAPPQNLVASDGSYDSKIALAWDGVSGAIGYRVYRAAAGGTPLLAGSVAVPYFNDVTAKGGVSYVYYVKARFPGGDTGASSTDGGWRRIAAPASVSATDGSSSAHVMVTWNFVVDSTGYVVFRTPEGGAAEQISGDLGSDAFSFVDTTAAAGTRYGYSVKAKSVVGDSFLSAADVGWRNVGYPSSINATNGASMLDLTVSWSAVAGATAYEVRRIAGGSEQTIATVNQLVYVDTTAMPGTSYLYRVRAKCELGPSQVSYGDYSAIVEGRIATDATPPSLSATNRASATSITLTWTVPTGSTPGSYAVLRASGRGKPKVIATLPAGVLAYVDSAGLKAGKTYTYSVRLATSTTGGATAQGVMAPAGPARVDATDGGLATGTTVTWSAAPKAIGYSVYRSPVGAGASPTFIGSVGKRTYSFTDTSGTPGTMYTYRVRANSSAGLSVSVSDTGWRALSAPTSLVATDNLTSTIEVTWTASIGATGYVVNRTGGSGAVQFIASANSYSDTSADVGVSYTYTVQATAGAVVSVASSADTGVRISGFMGSIMAAGGGSGSGKGGHGRGAQESAEGAAGDQAVEAPHHWLVDGTVVESGLVLFGDDDVVEVKLRDPASTDDMSILFVTGELSLGGRLVLDFGDRVPVVGDRWVILLAGRMSGEFRSVRGVDLPAGLRLETAIDGPTFSVTVVADDTQQ